MSVVRGSGSGGSGGNGGSGGRSLSSAGRDEILMFRLSVYSAPDTRSVPVLGAEGEYW